MALVRRVLLLHLSRQAKVDVEFVQKGIGMGFNFFWLNVCFVLAEHLTNKPTTVFVLPAKRMTPKKMLASHCHHHPHNV
jgi:hypothetical protein